MPAMMPIMKHKQSEKTLPIPEIRPSLFQSEHQTPILLPPRKFLALISYFKTPFSPLTSPVNFFFLYLEATIFSLQWVYCQIRRRPDHYLNYISGLGCFNFALLFPTGSLPQPQYNSTGTYLQGLQHKLHNWSRILEVASSCSRTRASNTHFYLQAGLISLSNKFWPPDWLSWDEGKLLLCLNF